MMTLSPRTRFLASMTAALLLSSCTSVRKELEHIPELMNPPINVTEYNYGAADALVGQAKSSLSLDTPISVGALQPVNLKPHEKIPPFGKVTSDQISSRLVQLGYHVRELGIPAVELMTMSEREWITRSREDGSGALITGNYTIDNYDVLVNVRLIQASDGRVLAATDYRLPLGSDTYKLLGRDPFFGLPDRPATPTAGVNNNGEAVTNRTSATTPMTIDNNSGQPVQIVPLPPVK